MNEPIRQHFTPQSYLRGFTPPERDDHLIVYSKLGGKQRSSSPMREGYECYLYEQELADGTRDKFSVEKLLGPLDSDGATLIREISNGVRLDPQRQWNLAFYVGMMVVRNPLMMSNLEVLSEAMMRDEFSREYRKATSHDINVVNDHCVAAAARWVYSPFQSNKIAKLVRARQGESYKLTPDSPFTAEFVRTWNANGAQHK